jgi:spore germination cell wall hydrolase CwlJ-like protein
MASYAMSNLCFRGVINLLKSVIFVLSLWATVAILWTVTSNKLTNLREQNQKIEIAQSTAVEKSKQLECLTKNVYWEAGGEPFEGKVAVAQVTLNRLESGKFGNSICNVVFQKNVFYQTVICQFSWTCTHMGKTKPINAKTYQESEEVAKKVYMENFRLPSLTKAMYFHSIHVSPGWGKTKIAQIGQHIFYKD